MVLFTCLLMARTKESQLWTSLKYVVMLTNLKQIYTQVHFYFFLSRFFVLLFDIALIKDPGKRGHIVADALLPTQMFPRLPARATFVADTKNVSDVVQKHFVSATNVSQFAQHGNTTFILCPARLRAQETS